MTAVRILLMIVATGLAAWWAHDFIETGAPSILLAIALMVVGVVMVVLSVAGWRASQKD